MTFPDRVAVAEALAVWVDGEYDDDFNVFWAARNVGTHVFITLNDEDGQEYKFSFTVEEDN